MLNIFIVILADMIGFGIMIPIFAYYVLQLGGDAQTATLLMGLYSFAMFCSAPLLGRLSDRYGRKPILMLSMLGASLGYLLLAFADSLWLVALSRLLSGAMAGNIAAAQAYIADITDESNRAKGMGMIGAAFGLGFVIGPALGSIMAGDQFAAANFMLPALTSAALSFVSFVGIALFLKESLSKELRQQNRAAPPYSQWTAFKGLYSQRLLLLIICCGVLFNVAAGLFESIFPIWAKDLTLISGPQGLAPMLLVSGFALAAVQGGLVGKLTRKFGEQQLLKFSSWLYAAAMLLMIISGANQLYWLVLLAMSMQAAATGLMLTCIQSLVSQKAAAHEKGRVMGLFSSAGTLARTLATFSTGSIYLLFGMQSPLILATCCVITLFFLAQAIQRQWSVS
ncbi:MFS transporter [Rheinheimera sp. 1928-s]|uniref:MFS transporter n=1 Tax=Rheinheimera sp. 1928-s TaxID=3033803 RepID=UPI002635FC1A|nr:MFS transporter [Rheinheimera sp. 1928-s]MDF3125311.1 MFS transporter [Rheinheimera sp. 1928-s]